MQYIVSNNGTQWTLDFGPDSVVFSVKGLDENITISSLELPLAVWSLLQSQRQEFFGNCLPRGSQNSQPTGFIEVREEILSCVRARVSDTRGYELSDLVDTDFSWEDPVVDMDGVYWPRIDTSFSPSIFDNFQMGSAAANPITVDHEEDKENSAPTTTTTTTALESERPSEPPRLLRSCPFGTRLENVPDFVYRFLFR